MSSLQLLSSGGSTRGRGARWGWGLVVIPLLVACEPACLNQPCAPVLLLRTGTGDADYAEGDVVVRVTIDGEVSECVTTLPAEEQAVIACGPAQLSYAREQECVRLPESGGIRCTPTGALEQTLAFVEDPPAQLRLEIELPDGTRFDRALEPVFERADPDRANCDACPRTVLEFAL